MPLFHSKPYLTTSGGGDTLSIFSTCRLTAFPLLHFLWPWKGLMPFLSLWLLLCHLQAVSLSCVRLFATLWTVAHQAPLFMGLSRREYWRRLPCPPAGDLPDPGVEPVSFLSPALAGRFFTTSATWETHFCPLTAVFYEVCPEPIPAAWGPKYSHGSLYLGWGQTFLLTPWASFLTVSLSTRAHISLLLYFPSILPNTK